MNIENNNDLRTAATLITCNVNKMCNSTDIDTIVNAFIEAKDQLIAVYKYQVEHNQHGK